MPQSNISDISKPVERKMNPIFTARNQRGFEEFNHLWQDSVMLCFVAISWEEGRKKRTSSAVADQGILILDIFFLIFLDKKKDKTTSSAVADQGSPRAFTTFEPFIVPLPFFFEANPTLRPLQLVSTMIHVFQREYHFLICYETVWLYFDPTKNQLLSRPAIAR